MAAPRSRSSPPKARSVVRVRDSPRRGTERDKITAPVRNELWRGEDRKSNKKRLHKYISRKQWGM